MNLRGRILTCIGASIGAATALVAIGCDPADPAPVAATPGSTPRDAAPWFVDVAPGAGLDFRHVSGDADTYYFPETVCGGGALFDLDNDGDLDAYLVQSGRIVDDPADRPPNQLFRNRGDGTFEDITAGSGAGDRGYGMSVTAGDYDNDGDVDLYVTNVGPNALLRNNGDGTFTDVARDAGVDHDGWGAGCAFVDYDADGDVDLFVTNYIYWSVGSERECYGAAGAQDYCAPNHYEAPAVDVLYRNEGDGRFTDVTVAAGIDQAFGNGLGVICGDFSGDGREDIFVANDGMSNQLWINEGDGTFVDEAMLRSCARDLGGQAKAGMGVASEDLDDDGDFDLLVVNIQTETDSFYRNAGDYFLDDTMTVGLGSVSRGFTRFGVGFVDFDRDGRLDLYQANGGVRRINSDAADPYAEPNVLFRGQADGRFVEVTPRGGTTAVEVLTSRAAVFGDVDGDGGVDILVVNRDGPANLLRNVTPRPGNWIMVRAVDEHGRDALGAVVEVEAAGRTQRRVVRAGWSYAASNDPRAHVGLGEATIVDRIAVTWPDGEREMFGSASVNGVVEVVRGSGESGNSDA